MSDTLVTNDLGQTFHALGQGERIPDPTVKTNLPKNLLSALGNAHVNLHFQVNKLTLLLDNVGWPEGESIHDYDVLGPPLSNALDYARENARLVWVILGLTDALDLALGEIVWGADGQIACMGNACDHDLGDQPQPHTVVEGSPLQH